MMLINRKVFVAQNQKNKQRSMPPNSRTFLNFSFKMEKGIEYLLEACIKFECSRSTRLRAMYFYHRIMSTIPRETYDCAMVAAACLSLSSKGSEEMIDSKTLILLFYCIIQRTNELLDTDDTTFKALRNSLERYDSLVTRKLEFFLNPRLAHQYLLPFLELVFARSPEASERHCAVSESSLSFASDLYTSRKCLDHKAEHIAIGCIDLALQLHHLVESFQVIKPWYKGLCDELTEELLQTLQQDILHIYKKEALIEPLQSAKSLQSEIHRLQEKQSHLDLQSERDFRSERDSHPERRSLSGLVQNPETDLEPKLNRLCMEDSALQEESAQAKTVSLPEIALKLEPDLALLTQIADIAAWQPEVAEQPDVLSQQVQMPQLETQPIPTAPSPLYEPADNYDSDDDVIEMEPEAGETGQKARKVIAEITLD